MLSLLAPALPPSERTDYLRALLSRGAPALEAWGRWRRVRPCLIETLKAEPCDALAATLPLLDVALTREGFALSAEERTRVRTARLREQLRAKAYATVLETAVSALRSSGEESLVLGGRPLGEWLHGDPSLHHSGAIDFLVRERSRGRAVAALMAAGFHNEGRVGDAPWTRHRLRDSSGMTVTVAETVLAHPWYRISEEAVWAGAVEVASADPLRMPAPHHQLALLALRGAWTGSTRSLLPILDSVLLFKRSGSLDWPALADDAERGRYALPLLAWLVFLRDAFSTPLPAEIESRLAAAVRNCRGLDLELALAASAAACEYDAAALLRASLAARTGSPLLRLVIVPSRPTLEWETGFVQPAGLAAIRLRRLARFAGRRLRHLVPG